MSLLILPGTKEFQTASQSQWTEFRHHLSQLPITGTRLKVGETISQGDYFPSNRTRKWELAGDTAGLVVTEGSNTVWVRPSPHPFPITSTPAPS